MNISEPKRRQRYSAQRLGQGLSAPSDRLPPQPIQTQPLYLEQLQQDIEEGYRIENSPEDESIPNWLWPQPRRRRKKRVSAVLTPERIVSPPPPQQIVEPRRIQPSPQQSIFQRSPQRLSPAFERYQREIYRTRDPLPREPRSVRPLASRRLSFFETEYSSPESSIPGSSRRSSFASERLSHQSIAPETIPPTPEPVEYHKFVSQLPPAFAMFQKQIYGPRDPMTGEAYGVEPLAIRRRSIDEPYIYSPPQQLEYQPRRMSTVEPSIPEPERLSTSPYSSRRPYRSTPLRRSPLQTEFVSQQGRYSDVSAEEESDGEMKPIGNVSDIKSARTQLSLPHLEADRQLLRDLGFYVKEKIGSGGFGDVYKGVCNEYAFKRYRDESTVDPNDPNSGVWKEVSLKGRYFALKFLILDMNEKDLIDEAKHLLELNHINVVDVYAVVTSLITDPIRRIKLYIIMEYSKYGDIGNFIDKTLGGVLSEFLYKDFVHQSIDGLLYIHSKMILHGDIAELNFLVFKDHRTGDYILKYSDFGLSASATELWSDDYGMDLQSLCKVWKNLLSYLTTYSEFADLMREFLNSLPDSAHWHYLTLQAIIDDNPWLLEE